MANSKATSVGNMIANEESKLSIRRRVIHKCFWQGLTQMESCTHAIFSLLGFVPNRVSDYRPE